MDHLNEIFGRLRGNFTALRNAIAPAVVAAREGKAIGGKVALGNGSLVAVDSYTELMNADLSTSHSAIFNAQVPLNLDVSTVDKYQGRDKDVVILSMVRKATSTSSCSGDENSPLVGDLLRDWRRINVAITRARLKLIIVGSGSTMEHVPILAELLHMTKRSNGMCSCPKTLLKCTVTYY